MISKTFTVMVSITGILIVLLVFMMGSVLAEQTVKTIELPLGYSAITSPNEVVSYNFTIDSPDGIADVISLEFVVKSDLLAGADVYGGLLLNGNPIWCDPAVWTVPPWNVDNYEIIFDCTSLLPDNFDWSSISDTPITFAFMNDNFAGNVKPRVRMTYFNNPETAMTAFGTEYQAGDANGTMFLQLVENMLPKNDASCVIDVYYPDKTYYLNGATMTYLNNSDGLYYKDMAIPNQLGVYMASAKCIYGIVYGQPEYVDNDIFVEGKEWNNDYTYTWSESTSYWKTREVDLLYDLQLNFSNVSLIGINPIELDIQFKVRNRCCQTWSGDTCTSGYSTPQEEFYIHIWNYSSSSWYQLPNVITDLVTSKQTVDNSLFQSSTNLLDLINNGEMILRVEEEGAGGWTVMRALIMTIFIFSSRVISQRLLKS